MQLEKYFSTDQISEMCASGAFSISTGQSSIDSPCKAPYLDTNYHGHKKWALKWAWISVKMNNRHP